MNIADILEHWAEQMPDTSAVIEPRGRNDRILTFGDLRAISASLGAALLARGVRAGDHVSIFTPFSNRLYIALIGTLRIGAVPVIVDPGLGLRQMRHCFRRIRPKCVLGTPRTLAIARLIPELWHATKVSVPARADRHACETVDVDSEAPALLTFTSGSTGQPKAVVRSHGVLIAQNRALARVLDPHPGDVSLATLPIFVLANLAEGVTSVLADADLRRPGFIDPAPVLAQIDRYRPTSTVASPAFLLRLAQHTKLGHRSDHLFSRVLTGGAPVFPDMVDAIAPLTQTGRVVVVYGSTEAEPITHLEELDPELREAVRSGAGLPVGTPIDDVRVRIVADSWGQPLGPMSQGKLDGLTIDDGSPGEIIVAGDHVVRGYLDGVGEHETKIHVGSEIWHRTGDAGRIDSSGRLWLLGRCAAKAITSEGKRIYPFPVEAAIRAETGMRCALTTRENQPTIMLETSGANFDTELTVRVERIAMEYGIESLQTITTIPMDSRHNAKIDYTRLAQVS